jgi:hypothetical protein
MTFKNSRKIKKSRMKKRQEQCNKEGKSSDKNCKIFISLIQAIVSCKHLHHKITKYIQPQAAAVFIFCV